MRDSTSDSRNTGARCLRVSPDGQTLATGDRSGNVRFVCFQYMVDMMYMLQVRLNLQVNLFQPRSVWGRYKTQVTGHCFTNTESILTIHES